MALDLKFLLQLAHQSEELQIRHTYNLCAAMRDATANSLFAGGSAIKAPKGPTHKSSSEDSLMPKFLSLLPPSHARPCAGRLP